MRLSEEARGVLAMLPCSPVGVPLPEIAEDLYGTDSPAARKRAHQVLQELKDEHWIVMFSDGRRSPGYRRLYAIWRRRWREAKALLSHGYPPYVALK